MIYSLRTFKQTGVQEDESIGSRFETIYRDSNPQEFDHHFDKTLGEDFKGDKENMYGMLYSEDICIPLYKTHRYYVVTEHGNTYANITFKS